MNDMEWLEDQFSRKDVREEEKKPECDWPALIEKLNRVSREIIEKRLDLLEAQHQWVLEEMADILLVLEVMNSNDRS